MNKTIILVSGLVLLCQFLPAMAAPPQQAKPKTFTQWCQQKNSVPVATRMTIDLLLKKASTQDCKQAEAKLSGLKSLNIDGKISDLQPLSSLTNLTELRIGNMDYLTIISDLQPLSRLTKLTILDLHSDRIRDIKPLSGLTNLDTLILDGGGIKDLKPLASLTKLKDLDLHNNQISDLKPLSRLTNLRTLTLTNNRISDLKPLAGLNKLGKIYLENNKITNKVCPLTNKSSDNGNLCEF
jgi:internalin A